MFFPLKPVEDEIELTSLRIGDRISEAQPLSPNQGWKRKFPAKTFALALFLFLTGSALIVGGVFLLGTDFERAIALLVLGCVCFLPGSYATYTFYKAFKKAPGYDVNSRMLKAVCPHRAVPSLDD